MLPLRGFPPVHVGMLWQAGRAPDGATSSLMTALRREGRRMSRGRSR
jgi:hypothetical protein